MKIPDSANAIFDRDEPAFFNTYSSKDELFQDPSGRSLLSSAIIEKLPRVIEFLLEFDDILTIPDKKGMLPLHICAVTNDVKTTKLLLEKGLNVDVKDFYGNTPLWRATFNSNYELAKLLVKFGANPEIKNNNGISPLDFAIEVEDEKLLEILR